MIGVTTRFPLHPVFTPGSRTQDQPGRCVTFGSLVRSGSRHLATASATRGQRNPTPRTSAVPTYFHSETSKFKETFPL